MERMRELIQQSTSGSTELAASAEQMSKMSRDLLSSMHRFIIDNIGDYGDSGGKQDKAGRAARGALAAHSEGPEISLNRGLHLVGLPVGGGTFGGPIAPRHEIARLPATTRPPRAP